MSCRVRSLLCRSQYTRSYCMPDCSGQWKAHWNKSGVNQQPQMDDLIEDGKNSKWVVCKFCQSKVLRPSTARYEEREVIYLAKCFHFYLKHYGPSVGNTQAREHSPSVVECGPFHVRLIAAPRSAFYVLTSDQTTDTNYTQGVGGGGGVGLSYERATKIRNLHH